jgi:hypothetical protein
MNNMVTQNNGSALITIGIGFLADTTHIKLGIIYIILGCFLMVFQSKVVPPAGPPSAPPTV